MSKRFEESVVEVASTLSEHDIKRIVVKYAARKQLSVGGVLHGWLREVSATERRQRELVLNRPESGYSYGMGAPSVEPTERKKKVCEPRLRSCDD